MRKILSLIMAGVFALLIFSCQSEKEQKAQKAIDRYIVFVDSVNKAKHDKRAERWDFIEMEHDRKRNDALQALETFTGKEKEKKNSNALASVMISLKASKQLYQTKKSPEGLFYIIL